jgi:hypothetical protein
LAVAYLPEFVVELHNGRVKPKFTLSALKLPPKIERRQAVYLVKRKSDSESKAYRQVAKVLRALK